MRKLYFTFECSFARVYDCFVSHVTVSSHMWLVSVSLTV